MAKESPLSRSQAIKLCATLFVGVPLWLIFAAVARHIPLKSMRIRGDQLQLPVITYAHVDSGEQIIFLAVMHLADPAYYAELQGLIEEYPKYSVLYEMISKLSPEEREKLTEDEEKVLQTLEAGSKVIALAQELLGVANQKDSLAYSSTWVRTDLGMYDLLQRLAANRLRLRPANMRVIQQERFQPFIQWLLDHLFRNSAALILLMRLALPFSKSKREKEILLDVRNEIGVAAILKCIPNRNVIAIWGAEHLSGMHTMLRKEGFREIERRWINAYRSRGYSIRNVLKGLSEHTEKAAESVA